jgi:hypothetical protein
MLEYDHVAKFRRKNRCDLFEEMDRSNRFSLNDPQDPVEPPEVRGERDPNIIEKNKIKESYESKMDKGNRKSQ